MAEHIASLLELEKRLRVAHSSKQLYYTIANQTHSCLSYVQSVLVTRCPLREYQVAAASDIPVIDYTSPFVRWMETLGQNLLVEHDCKEILEVHKGKVSAGLQEDWSEMAPEYLLVIPLRDASEREKSPAYLLLFRDEPWAESDKIIADHLSESMGHALLALDKPNFLTQLRAKFKLRKVAAGIVLALVLVLCLPVRLSTIAPVEVIAKDPHVVSAPMQGVVREVTIEPNATVEPENLLVEFEDIELKSEFEIAQQSLNVALAELKTAEQTGFLDPAIKARRAELKATVELRTVERDYAAEKLAKAELRTTEAGVVVLEDPSAWKGRPVSVGERILLVADPSQIELEIMLPVKDSIALKESAETKLFFDHEPLKVWEGVIRYASYSPTITPEDVVAYRLIAELNVEDATEILPRIGMRGTAKLYGERVSLFFLLFRRPITGFRQWLGW